MVNKKSMVGLAGTALLITAYVVEARTEVAERLAFPAPGKLVDVGNGRRIDIVCSGSTQASPTIVLEAGADTPALTLKPMQVELQADHRVCRYDRAGFGWSDPAAPNRNFDDRAADLHTALRGVGETRPVVLVGEAYGSLIARRYAVDYPKDVAGVAIVDGVDEAKVFKNIRSYQLPYAALTMLGKLAAPFGGVRAAMHFVVAEALSINHLSQDDGAVLVAQAARPEQYAAQADEISGFTKAPAAEQLAGNIGNLGNAPLLVIGRDGSEAEVSHYTAPLAQFASLSTNSTTVATNASFVRGLAEEHPEIVATAIAKFVDKLGSPDDLRLTMR